MVSTFKLGDNLLFVGALLGQPVTATETHYSSSHLFLGAAFGDHFTGSFIHSNFVAFGRTLKLLFSYINVILPFGGAIVSFCLAKGSPNE